MEVPKWSAYDHYPDLSKARRVAIDVETNDPNLMDKGPGTIRKDGYICGFSVASDDGFKGYYPIRHSEGNVEYPEKAKEWFKSICENIDIPKIGANILYDAEWIKSDFGFDIKGKKYDVQIAAPLLDENYFTYKLDALAERWLGLHKDDDHLFQAGVEVLGITSRVQTPEGRKTDIVNKTKAQLWKLPACYVGNYGEADAELPIKIFELQEKELRKQDLWSIFIMECEVLDMLFAMRFQGIPVDIPAAEKAKETLQLELDDIMRKIKRRTGVELEIWSGEEVAKCCDALGLPYLRTKPTKSYPNGNPSFDAEWLKEQEHQFFKFLLEARQLNRSGGVFIEKKIIDMAVNGRVYPSFWQVKSEAHGTVSGRFSSSNPNAQQFPARNEKLKKVVRGLFIPEPGCKWHCFDYKQQEPKVMIHYAYLLGLPGAAEARQAFIDNPKNDYHQLVSNWTGFIRKTAKNINLGLGYGMGPKKYSEKYNKTLTEARELFNIYHRSLPFVRPLTRRCERIVKQRGYIKTLLGRHCHFNLYGPPNWKSGDKPLRHEEAIKEYGLPVTQYFTYRAMNRLVQGSSADMIKKAMVECWKAGYLPNITVHDELDFAYLENQKQVNEIEEIMRTCVKIEVPLSIDIEIGDNWGNCKVFEEETF